MIVNEDKPSTDTSIAGKNRRHIQAPSAKGAKPAGYWVSEE